MLHEYLFIKTHKTLRKLEKEFVKELETLSKEQLSDLKRQKVAKAILYSPDGSPVRSLFARSAAQHTAYSVFACTCMVGMLYSVSNNIM